MFVGWYSSDSGRPGIGCCGLPFLIVPLFCLFSGFNDSSFLLLMVLIGLFVMFALPRVTNLSAPAYAGDGKYKNEDYPDKPKNEDAFDKPKRDEYVISPDGEVMEVVDDDPLNRTQPPL